MTLDQARRIIDNPGITPMADWSLAGRVIYRHYQDNPHLLKPTTLTRDAKPKRRVTRDQAQPARKLMQLPGRADAYRIMADPDDGTCWLYEEGGQTGKPPPSASPDLMEASPALKMGPGMMGDISRHRAVTAARDKGRAFAEQFNQKQRQRWGQ